MNAVEVSGLYNISFSLPEGKSLGITGEGREKLMEQILGLCPGGEGRVSILGGSMEDITVRRQLGISPGLPGFPPSFSPKDIAKLMAGLYKDWREKDFEYLTGKLSIPTDKPLGELDEGLQRKLSLALAMAPRPKMLILCEPFSGLDTESQAIVRSLIRAFSSKEGYSLLITGESREALEGLCDEIIWVNGEVQA